MGGGQFTVTSGPALRRALAPATRVGGPPTLLVAAAALGEHPQGVTSRSRPSVADVMRPLRPFVARAEVAQLRRCGRSALGVLFRTDVLVLTTTGRRTGRVRETPVAYLDHDGGWLICAGAGGQPAVDWVANLRARPRASVTVRRVTFDVLADELSGDRYSTARARALDRWPKVARYERRAGRAVPIFLLRPATGR